MADIFSKFHESDGVTGDVKFYYKGPYDSDKSLFATKTLTPEGFGPGETRGFNYGIRLCSADQDSVEVTLICDTPKGQFSMSKEILVKESSCDLKSMLDEIDVTGPLDSDGDRIPDNLDQCPDTPPNQVVDLNGCPYVLSDDSTSTEAVIGTAAGSSVPGCEKTADGCYSPSTITVNVGEVVTFTNTDDKPHTFTSGSPATGATGVFDTSLLSAGESFEWVPNTSGEIPYFCMIHAWMQGSIIVEAAVTTSDSDGDGVPDNEDPCPEVFGNIGGCPDTPIILPPSAPTSLTTSASDGSVLLKWQTPDDEGGWEGLVKDYIIEYKSESDSTWQVFDDGYSDSTSALVTNLQNDIQYQFRVSGENDGRLGLGDVSTIVTATPTSANAPTIESSSADEGGGCLIATATYGSELAPQVQQLRELRDNSLLNTESGSAFMESFNDVYYSFSPYIADLERENPVFKEMVKIAITPMISSLSILNYVEMDSESSVLGYGISLILLNIGMYVGIPAIVIVGIRKKF